MMLSGIIVEVLRALFIVIVAFIMLRDLFELWIGYKEASEGYEDVNTVIKKCLHPRIAPLVQTPHKIKFHLMYYLVCGNRQWWTQKPV